MSVLEPHVRNIRTWLSKRRITRRELATGTQISLTALNQKLSGRSDFSVRELRNVASVLNIAPRTLLEGE